MLLDPREPADFAAGHLHGAVNVGLQGRFAEWAGAVLPDSPGETTLRARATDLAGHTQPERPRWNRLGYGGNAVQTIPLLSL